MQAEVASKLSVFISVLLADWHLGAWVPNMPKRAKWLREIFESLGPAYIKIAQALSTRIDLVPEAYLKEFAQLQDNVAPFNTQEALNLIESEFGMRLDHVCLSLCSSVDDATCSIKIHNGLKLFGSEQISSITMSNLFGIPCDEKLCVLLAQSFAC